MNKLLVGLSVFALASAVCATDEGQCLKDGDNVVLIGDSITEQGFRRPWGYYHVLTNVADEVAKAGGPKVNFIPLGYSGYQVKGWSDMERDSVTNTNVWTWYRNPGWNLKEVFDGKVDVIVIFLGMNDILQPSMRDTDEDRAKWLADYKTFVNNLRTRCHPRQFVIATITPLTMDMLSAKNRVRTKLCDLLAEWAAETPDVACSGFSGGIGDVMRWGQIFNTTYRPVPDFVHPQKLGHWGMASYLLKTLREPNFNRFILEHPNRKPDFENRPLNVRFELGEGNEPTHDRFNYYLGYSLLLTPEMLAKDASALKVSVELPAGWVAKVNDIGGRYDKLSRGFAVVSGIPEKALNPVTFVFTLDGKEVARETFNIPAPWKLSEDGGPWTFYTATEDYTGGAKPGSIDPYQCFFGWKTNTLKAARRVWSEKEREVKAVLSHQGFSQTLDLTVAFDGAEVWKDNLNRNGRNHIEKTLHLKKGWNAIEITCVHHDWQRQFAFDLEPLDGDDLSNLKYDLK